MTANTGGQIVVDTRDRVSLGLLIGCHIVTCCVSLAYLSHHFEFYFFYDPKLTPRSLFPQETPLPFASSSDVWAWLRQRNRQKVDA